MANPLRTPSDFQPRMVSTPTWGFSSLVGTEINPSFQHPMTPITSVGYATTQSPTIRQMTPSTNQGVIYLSPAQVTQTGNLREPHPWVSSLNVTSTHNPRSITLSTPSALNTGNLCANPFQMTCRGSTNNVLGNNPYTSSQTYQAQSNPFLNYGNSTAQAYYANQYGINSSMNSNIPIFQNSPYQVCGVAYSHMTQSSNELNNAGALYSLASTASQPVPSQTLGYAMPPCSGTHNSVNSRELDLMFGDTQFVDTNNPVNPLQSNNCYTCHKNRVDAPTYNGKEKWDTFISLFEKVADINNWEGSVKCKRLLVALRGSALEFADTLQLRVTKDFDLMKEAMSTRFGVTSNESLYRVKFKGRRRNHNETLDKFMQELQYLAERAYPNVL